MFELSRALCFRNYYLWVITTIIAVHGAALIHFGSSYTFLCFFWCFFLSPVYLPSFLVWYCSSVSDDQTPQPYRAITLQHRELFALLFCSKCCQTRMGLTITSIQFATNCCHCSCGGGVVCCIYSNERSYLGHIEREGVHGASTNIVLILGQIWAIQSDMVLWQVFCSVILLVMILILMVTILFP